jgi:hypothetical protein
MLLRVFARISSTAFSYEVVRLIELKQFKNMSSLFCFSLPCPSNARPSEGIIKSIDKNVKIMVFFYQTFCCPPLRVYLVLFFE